VGRVYPRYRCGGRFFGRRVNCEYVPALPALAVRRVFDDPRKIPYLLIWRSDRDGEVKEAVRVSRVDRPSDLPAADFIEIKRTDGSVSRIRAIKWSLPRNGAYTILLACPFCCALRRALYAWEPGGQYTSSVQRCGWQCRKCARLRYSSEGGALVLRGGPISRLLRMEFPDMFSPRPDPWCPYLFTSVQDAIAAGIVGPGDGPV
jgi:hypothetical protein